MPESEEAIRVKLRSEFIRIATIEANYWASAPSSESTSDIQAGIQFGGMGAASNIIAAVFMGKTAEQYQSEVEKRAKS